MAEVTANLPNEHFPGGVNGATMVIGNITVANSGDTWTHGLRAALAYGSNNPGAVTLIAGDGNVATLTTTGAVVGVKIWVLGYA